MRTLHIYNDDRVLAAVVLSVFSCVVSVAQKEVPAPQSRSTVAPDKNQQSAATIKRKVREVSLDVVVTDRNNNPVTGLGPQDFSVFEDGKLQHITSFEAHTATADTAKLARQVPQLSGLPPNTFLSISTPRDDLPLNVLLYDVLNTPVEDQPFARKQIIKFLENRPRHTRFAIFVLSGRLHLLQGFTDDEDRLVSSLNRREAGTAVTLFSPAPAEAATLSDSLSDREGIPAMIDRLEHMDSMAESYFLARRVEKTINAFLEISRFLGGWSGRKNLIWLSGGFPAGVLPGGEAVDPFAATVNYSPEIHEAVDRMVLSQVAVYPVDIRGLTVGPMFSPAGTFRTADSPSEAQAKFALQLAAEHMTMDELAEGSGGRAFYNTNGLERALAVAAEDGANYYTLNYSPTNTNFDGGLRKIRVRLPRKSYSLSYRRGYFADDENKWLEKAAAVPFAHIGGTMQRGAPLAHEIEFEVQASTEGAPSNVIPENVAELSQFAAFSARKKWDDVKIQRYSFDFRIRGHELPFRAPLDGTHHVHLEFLVAAYDTDGIPLCGRLSSGDEAISAETFETFRRGTLHTRLQFDAPTQAAWLRLAVRDPVENRVGSVEIRLPLNPVGPPEKSTTR
jgi:VWFA-related protein